MYIYIFFSGMKEKLLTEGLKQEESTPSSFMPFVFLSSVYTGVLALASHVCVNRD